MEGHWNSFIVLTILTKFYILMAFHCFFVLNYTEQAYNCSFMIQRIKQAITTAALYNLLNFPEILEYLIFIKIFEILVLTKIIRYEFILSFIA